MGNQQEVSIEDRAWLAGMLNGDGCFSMWLRRVDKRWKCDVSITLTQCDPCVINRTTKMLISMIGCNPTISEYAASGKGKKTRYNLRVSKMVHMANLLSAVLPYMCGAKQAKGELMLRFLNNRLNRMGESRKMNHFDDSYEDMKLVDRFYDLCGKKPPKEFAKILRDHPQGVGSSGPKRTAPKGEDMVQSCLRGQAC